MPRMQQNHFAVEMKPLEKVYQGSITKKATESNTNSGATNSPTTGGSNTSALVDENSQKPGVVDC